MMFKFHGLLASIFYLVHEDPPVVDDTIVDDPDDDAAAKAAAALAAKNKVKLKVPLTDEQQQFVNSILAEEKRKAKLSNDKLITQLETLKNGVSTTTAEKEALELRIEDLRNQHLTADELRKKEEKKEKSKVAAELAVAKAETEKWKGLYTDSTIERSILDAAALPAHKAGNPAHIIAILKPNTRLVEVLDDDGKPTGELVPKVRVKTEKDGKPATLEMAVTEAVKFLSEQPEHETLFDSGATGGLGGNPNNPRRKGSDSDEPPTDPVEYRKWRDRNRDKVGARPLSTKK